jgi:glycosyltransferase involved in cell wall biosynthesis
LKSANAVIAVNRSHRDIAVRRGRIDANKVTVVRSGPRRAWSDIQGCRPQLKGNRKYLVVYLGEMCAQDGVDHLLRAIRHYADYYPNDTLFALIGGGPEQSRMKEMAHQMQLNDWVKFTGRVADEVLWEYLATADLCIDPDPFTEWSNLSTMNKVIEYLAFGKPVVAFDLTENRRTAQDAAAYVKGNNHIELSITTRKLLIDERRRWQMGRRGRQRFRTHLAWENSEEELIRIYSRLLGSEQTRSASAIPSEADALT